MIIGLTKIYNSAKSKKNKKIKNKKIKGGIHYFLLLLFKAKTRPFFTIHVVNGKGVYFGLVGCKLGLALISNLPTIWGLNFLLAHL